MYVLPSMSVMWQPSASLMNSGVPPTALNARTGELTPPGMTCRALAKAGSELAMLRVGWMCMRVGEAMRLSGRLWRSRIASDLMGTPRGSQRTIAAAGDFVQRAWVVARYTDGR